MVKIRIFICIIFSFLLLLNTTFAALPNPTNFINAGLKNANLNTERLIGIMDETIGGGLVSILQVLYNIGLAIAVCVLIFMGVQIIIASPQQKAQIKSAMLPYFIGLLLFVAGVPIAILIIKIFTQIF